MSSSLIAVPEERILSCVQDCVKIHTEEKT